jgi:hypothetical protein
MHWLVRGVRALGRGLLAVCRWSLSLARGTLVVGLMALGRAFGPRIPEPVRRNLPAEVQRK